MLIPSSMRYIQTNIHVNIYVAVNFMIGGPDISGTGYYVYIFLMSDLKAH
jgi:hypothetical protein